MTTYIAIPQAVVDAMRYMIRQMSDEDTDYQRISTASSILAIVRFLLVKNNMLRCKHSIRADGSWHAHCRGCGALFKRNGNDDAWHERDILVYGRLFEMLDLIGMKNVRKTSMDCNEYLEHE